MYNYKFPNLFPYNDIIALIIVNVLLVKNRNIQVDET